LPPIILGAIALLAATVGTWPLVTTYLYWQWFHFTRQSYGVSRAYVRRAGVALADEKLTHWLVYLVPIWGIVYRSYEAPAMYLGSELRVIPIPFGVVAVLGTVTAALLFRVFRAINNFLRSPDVRAVGRRSAGAAGGVSGVLRDQFSPLHRGRPGVAVEAQATSGDRMIEVYRIRRAVGRLS